MRKFSNVEKCLIRELITHEALTNEGLIQVAVFIEDLLIEPDKNLSLLLRPSESSVYVSFPEEEREAARGKFIEVLTLLNLLRELQYEGKIVLLGESTKSDTEAGQQFDEGTTMEIPQPLANFVIDSWKKYILVSEDLKSFVDKDFRSPEEIRHKKSITVAIVALVTSIVLGLWGILRDVILSCA
ncbi:MAG: hypothetical protein GVY12_02230 [Bacteroidetes bacterium]|jgi:hypothetical protein|nr:hypothetical protein [Bacteroidota bacterium]